MFTQELKQILTMVGKLVKSYHYFFTNVSRFQVEIQELDRYTRKLKISILSILYVYLL